jgi:hypothetical protein
LSSSGSESEKEAKDRFSWASIRGWTSRSNSTTPSSRNTGVFTTLDGPQTPQQPPMTRSRRGTNGSVASDTVRFHRDVFMKGVDKDAKVMYFCTRRAQVDPLDVAVYKRQPLLLTVSVVIFRFLLVIHDGVCRDTGVCSVCSGPN